MKNKKLEHRSTENGCEEGCEACQQEAQHTPTPWNHRPKDLQSPVRYLTIEDGRFDRIIAHILPTNKDDAFANAAFIVQAVNAHEMLVATLKELLSEGVSSDSQKFLIESAIAKAEGK